MENIIIRYKNWREGGLEGNQNRNINNKNTILRTRIGKLTIDDKSPEQAIRVSEREEVSVILLEHRTGSLLLQCMQKKSEVEVN